MERAEASATDPPLSLPEGDFKSFCWGLLDEGIRYNQLPSDKVAKVGSHVGFLLHDLPDGKGRWISIHFRENLDSLQKFTGLDRAKAFLINLREDLRLLAERLAKELKDVRVIYGLSQLSAKWGENHGFKTAEYTPDPEILRAHCESIGFLSPQMNNPSLTLFSFGRKGFIREFLKGSKPASVPEPVR